MGFQIEDGRGSGRTAAVNEQNQLTVHAVMEAAQKYSTETGRAYQIIGDFAALNNSTHTILNIVNTSSTQRAFISYIRCQIIGAAGGNFTAATRFEIGTGRTVASGGSTVTAVNMSFGSGLLAEMTSTDNNPTMTGTFTEIDRWYPKENGEMQTFRKEGSIMLSKNNSLEIRCVTDHTSGTAYARVSFYYEDIA